MKLTVRLFGRSYLTTSGLVVLSVATIVGVVVAEVGFLLWARLP